MEWIAWQDEDYCPDGLAKEETIVAAMCFIMSGDFSGTENSQPVRAYLLQAHK